MMNNQTAVVNFLFQKILVSFGIFTSILMGAANVQNKIIPYNNPQIYYEGRILYNHDAAELYWSGTSETILFKGSSISAILKDSDTANYYNVILDDDVVQKIHTDTFKQSYQLAAGLSNTKHKVQLFKRTEWIWAKHYFMDLQQQAALKYYHPLFQKSGKLNFMATLLLVATAQKTAAAMIQERDTLKIITLIMFAITARHFNAQYYTISRSSIGVTISWDPLIMPEMYNRTDATYSASKWDFKKYTPNIVAVNLFQNDS